MEELNLYNNPSSNKSWICPKCCANEFPFYEVTTNELQLDNNIPRNAKGGIDIILDNNLENFVKECNLISINTNDEQNDDDLYNNINS